MTHQSPQRYRALFSPPLPLDVIFANLRPFNTVAPATLKRLEQQLHARDRYLRAALFDVQNAHSSLQALSRMLRQGQQQPCPCDVLHMALEPAQQKLQRGLETLLALH